MSKQKKQSGKILSKSRSKNSVLLAPRLHLLVAAGVIALAVFLAYQPSINGNFVLDDDIIITENPNIKAADGLYRFWSTAKEQDYWPLTYTMLWIEWRIWERHPTGYHLTGLILHIAEALLICIILRKLSIPGAFLAALIFAVHPVNVESVAWISEQKNTMAMLFILLSILWYLKFLMPTTSMGRAPAHSHGGLPAGENLKNPGIAPLRVAAKLIPNSQSLIPIWYWLSLSAFVPALFSKGSVAVLPVLLLGIIWWLRTQGTVPIFASAKMGLSPSATQDPAPAKTGLPPSVFTSGDLLRITPFFLAAAVLACVNVWFQKHGGDEIYRAAGFIERLLGAGAAPWFYLYEAIFPIDLYFVYPMWHIHTDKLLWWIPLFASIVVTIILWRHRKGWSRPFLFAWFFYCVSLGPVAGFVDIGFMRYSLVADRYQHISIIGLVALSAAGWSLWRQKTRGTMRRAATIAAIAASVTLLFLAWRQNRIYTDEPTLYHATLKKNPDCWMAHNNLGFLLAMQSIDQEKMGNLTMAASQNPAATVNAQKAAFLKKGAEEHFRKAADLNHQACEHFRQAVYFNPDYGVAQNNLGSMLNKLGQLKEAEEHFRRAIQGKKNCAEACCNLGNVLLKTARAREAMEYLQQALRLKPDYLEARKALGDAYLNTDRYQEAIEQYGQALKTADMFELHFNLGVAMHKTGRLNEAIGHYQQAVRQKPDFVEGYFNLTLAYAALNRTSDAQTSARRALDLARSQGQTALSGKIEDWLNSNRPGSDTPLPKTSPSIKE
jgi:tetratricopeptide (TPR) repeat protein